MKKNATTTTETAAAVITAAVFAKSRNIAEAIREHTGLPENTVVIVADEDNDAYKTMSAFKGTVYSQQLQEQRLGKSQVKVPLWPKGVKVPNLGNSALAKSLADKAKKEAWEALRDPKTPVDVIKANLGDPVPVIGLEMNSTNQQIYDACKGVIEAAGAEATEAFGILEVLFGLKAAE